MDDDAQEWLAAEEEFSSEVGLEETINKKEEGVPNADDPEQESPEKNEELPQEEAEPEEPSDKEEPADGDRDDDGPDESAETNKSDSEDKPERAERKSNPVREAREAQRELAADREAVSKDIREQLYADIQTELVDADGEPIRTIEDVMQLRNPNTGQAFTAEEAGAYLLNAQRSLEKKLESIDREIEEIADTNLTIKDDSESIREDYGEFLDANPEIRQKIWQAYERTLTKDPKTGIITKAPVSLKQFYSDALAPYIEAQAAKSEAEKARAEAEEIRTKAEQERAEAEEKKARKQEHTDREDIYSAGKTDATDPEDKEWASVAKEYYED